MLTGDERGVNKLKSIMLLLEKAANEKRRPSGEDSL